MWVKSMKTLPCAFRPELMVKESNRLSFPFRLCPCAKGVEDLVRHSGIQPESAIIAALHIELMAQIGGPYWI